MKKNSRLGLVVSLLACLVLLATARTATAQEFTLFGGKTTAFDLSQSTYAWKIEYRQGLGEHFEFSYSWLNEGHISGHQRDGHIPQIWARQTFLDRRVTLALGVGTMRYYDTQAAAGADGYADVHGWAGIASLDAAYYVGKRWITRLQVNRTWAPSTSVDTWDFLLGLGYQLTAPDEPGPRSLPERQAQPTTRNEVTAFVGQTVVNSFNSQNSVAASLEYRRGLGQYFDVSAAFLYEGNSQLVRRGGFIVQGWLGRSFFDDHVAISIGLGPYIAVDTYEENSSGKGAGTIAGMITPSFSYRFSERWLGRFTWNRVFTTYNKDTDVFQLGIGYRF